MFGIGKLLGRWKLYRMVSPVLSVFESKEGWDKMKSRKLWITVIVGSLGVLATQLGVEIDQWEKVSEWLLKLLLGYFAANVGEHVASALKAKKAG